MVVRCPVFSSANLSSAYTPPKSNRSLIVTELLDRSSILLGYPASKGVRVSLCKLEILRVLN